MIPAEREWGRTIPLWVKNWNVPRLAYSQASNGSFGYTSASTVWGPYATTPSGMVQMVMDGIGRGMTGPGGAPSWDKAETYLRDRFGNSGGASNAIKDYYYGLYSFVKAMLFYPYNGDENALTPDPTPIKLLRSQTAGVPPLDWYAAEVSKGDPTDGVARTLVNDQSFSTQWGYWYGHNYSGDQYPFETAWAIQMLNQTIVNPGAPVAVGKAVPNPCVVGQAVTLDGSDSYHQGQGRQIVFWEWDVNNDGVYDAVGPTCSTIYSGVGNYPTTLRVTDDSSPAQSAVTTFTVRVTTPPVAPTADANGPYVFCPQAQPWFLDGRLSRNPDEGQSEPGQPGDTIQTYAWELDGDNDFNDAFGPTPDVTAFFTAKGAGEYIIQLRVTDTTATSFPSSGYPDLVNTSPETRVYVKAATDPNCACVTLSGTVSGQTVLLGWTALPSAHHYNVYRSQASGGPYFWLDETAGLTYADSSGISGDTYYYVVRPAALNGDELCQSNEIEATPQCLPPLADATPTTKISNLSRYYRELSVSSDCYGRMQLKVWIGDTMTPAFKAGPYKASDIIRISKAAAATVKPGVYGAAANITVQGQGTVWAEGPLGETGVPKPFLTY